MYPIIIEVKNIWKTDEEEKIKHKKSKINIFLSFIFVFIGIISLKIGGDLVSDIATRIAIRSGLSERTVGLTIVALGTALPELVTSVFVALKNEVGLATGNLVGSCIINICLILGTGAIITPEYVTRHFKDVIKKYKLRPLRFHDLRHSCASLLLANDVSMKAIQDWLGHSTFNVAANFYSHLDYKSRISSAEAISNALGNI